MAGILGDMEPRTNKKARFDYSILETFEAGIVLSGAEVKSVKSGLARLDGSYVLVRGGEAILRGAHIARYPKSGLDQADYTADRDRKLLLTKRELAYLEGALSQKGLTVVPLSVYSSKRLIKVKLALARGKRNIDKREAIKKREFQRRLNSRVR